MTRKGLSLNNFLADMSPNTAEDGLGSIKMRAVWRKEEKSMAIAIDGVLHPLGLVELGVVHENYTASGLETGEKLGL